MDTAAARGHYLLQTCVVRQETTHFTRIKGELTPFMLWRGKIECFYPSKQCWRHHSLITVNQTQLDRLPDYNKQIISSPGCSGDVTSAASV